MSAWIFLYIIAAIFNIAIAYFFFKSKDGWTRKYLIAMFSTLAWSYLVRGVWGLFCTEIGDSFVSIFSLIGIIPNLVISLMFIHYLLKKNSK